MADDVKQPADKTPTDAPVAPPETKFTSAKEDPVSGVRNADAVTPEVDLKATAPSAETVTPPVDEQKPAAPAVNTGTATATAPAEEKKADAPLNNAPAAPTTETEAEIAERKKKEAAAQAPQQQTPNKPTADTPLDEEQLTQSKFGTNLNVHPDSLAKMREVWPDPNFQIDPELARALGPEGKVYPHKGGLVFELQNNHAIEWHANLGGTEFIGMPNRSKHFDEVDAHGVMAAAKTRGWKAVNVYGSPEQKDMMWLEAMKQGLGVANYAPREGSPAMEAFKQMKADSEAANIDKLLVGASAAEQGAMDLSNSKFAPPADEKKPETTAETPKAPAAETNTPEAPVAAPKSLDGIEAFLDKKIEATKGEPELQKGIIAIREGIDKKGITLDETSAGLLRVSLGGEDGAVQPAKYNEVARFLEADKGNAGLKLPTIAAKEPATPATPVSTATNTVVPKEAKSPKVNTVAPA